LIKALKIVGPSTLRPFDFAQGSGGNAHRIEVGNALQLLKLFLKTDSKRIPDDLAVGLIRFSTLHLGFDLNNA
jgi:hypothetical protein